MRYLSLLTLLLSTFLFYSSLTAQEQVDTYKKAVDDINCALAKKMLISFERASLAKNITACTYEVINRETNKIIENQTKGYKQEILNITSRINQYKTKIDNPSEYLVFESNLDELSAFSKESFEGICNKYAKPTNSVCRDYDKNSDLLDQELTNIVNSALISIGKKTYGGEKANNRTPKTEPKTEEKKEVKPKETKSSKDSKVQDTNSAESGGNSSSLASIVSTIILVLLIAAVGWLYKEQQELKEQLEDIRMMLRVFNRNKPES